MPAVFHCTAGKDRTGLLSAIVLSLLGVDEETVVADYALSGEAMGRLRDKIVSKYPDSKTLLDNLDEVFSAHPTKMVNLLAYLREHYGSVEAYAAGIGVPPEVVEALRAALVQPTAP
jgi:protein-tyrosine phosphatase